MTLSIISSSSLVVVGVGAIEVIAGDGADVLEDRDVDGIEEDEDVAVEAE